MPLPFPCPVGGRGGGVVCGCCWFRAGVLLVMLVVLVGDGEVGTPVSVESTLKYHSGHSGHLTSARDPGQEQCLMGSLTGAVAS